MAVVLRLMRAGAKKRPFYRVVAADSRRQRDGRFIEILGHYDPIATPMTLKVDTEKAAKWISVGAQPSVQVASLLKRAGMDLYKPTAKKPEKPVAETPKPAARKTAAKRAAPRKKSERKTDKKAARKTAKTSGKTAAKTKKKSAQ
jgi:small subunit ribosomal protein S16